MTTPYDFKTQKHIGEAAEAMLDAHFGNWFDITPATDAEQRKGIDRHYTLRIDGRVFTVEYKCDLIAGKTGNAFVETVSVDSAHRSGWGYTCSANWLLYFVPDDLLVYMLRMRDVTKLLPHWEQQYPHKSTNNGSYQTHGVLVPLVEFEKLAFQVVSL